MKHITTADFPATIASPTLTIVDFYADWCGPCRMLAPILDQLDAEAAGRFSIAKLNIDDNQSLAQQYKVMTIPTLIYFKNGEELARASGVMTKQAILDQIAALS